MCIVTQERLFFNLLLPLAVQRNILLIPFKGINPANAVLHAVILHIACRRQASAVIDGKHDFFITPVCRHCEYFLAGNAPTRLGIMDNSGANDMRNLFKSLRNKGKTIILASHNPLDIDELCDTVHEMDAGHMSLVR